MTPEAILQKGFNHGYMLEKHNPELSQKIQAGFTDKEHPYAKGFLAGSKEFALEKSNEKGKYNPELLKRPTRASHEKGANDKGFDL